MLSLAKAGQVLASYIKVWLGRNGYYFYSGRPGICHRRSPLSIPPVEITQVGCPKSPR